MLAPAEDTLLDYPSLNEIRNNRSRLGDLVRETPVWQASDTLVGASTQIFFKLELFQYTGSFKPRGALTVMLDLAAEERARGVTAVSAGNHAIAVAFSARLLGTTAKVVMPKSANRFRVERCRAYGAAVELADDVQQAFARAQQIQEEEGRVFVHPFEGPLTALGTATAGLEFASQVPALDAVLIPIGGGGLCAGMACAFKQLQPACRVIGVEPFGADSMYRSFQSGMPCAIDKVRTIADSLGAPYALPYSFALCRRFVDDLVRVEEGALQRAMRLLFEELKLAVEPAGAAATAALCEPLRDALAGQRVGVMVCGSNIDLATFASQAAAEPTSQGSGG